MQQETKLVECQDLEGKTLSFVILNNQLIGKGSYGSVKKAYQQNNQHQQLAVKIIKNGNQKSKAEIERQIEVLRNLQNHSNLVKVLPLQCFSEKNFYIFMEYCNQGTLGDKMRSKTANQQNFLQSEIFKAFYQILKGYQVLWKKNILHQDLKPDNVLIHNGNYKLADFGFSIFYKDVKLDKYRLGTCYYMPLQKLTEPDYDAHPKSDVFSLGVIFFKMITQRHPYVLQQYDNYKQYVALLRKSKLSIPSYIKSRLSIPMQELFDLIIRMVAKDERNRVDFDEIYEFINEHEAFIEMNKAQKENSQFYSVQVDVSKQSSLLKPSVKFVQVSKAFMIPFSIPKSQQEEYLKRLKENKVKAEQKAQIETVIKLQKYICSMRIMVYFFDRLTRRLFVEKKKKEIKNWKQDDVTQIQQNAILALVHTAKKITVQTIQDSCYQRVFKPQEWKIFKSTKPPVLKLVEKDKQFLSTLANQLAIESKQSKISDRLRIIQNSNKPLLQYLTSDVRQLLMRLLRTRTTMIPVDNKQSLTTIYFILNAIDIIDNFQERHQNWEQLQTMLRKMESEELVMLIEKVTAGLERLNMHYSLDLGDLGQQEEENN